MEAAVDTARRTVDAREMAAMPRSVLAVPLQEAKKREDDLHCLATTKGLAAKKQPKFVVPLLPAKETQPCHLLILLLY